MGDNEAGQQKSQRGPQRSRKNYRPRIRLKRGTPRCPKLRDNRDSCSPGFYLQGEVIGQLNSVFGYLTPVKEFWYLSVSSTLWPGRG